MRIDADNADRFADIEIAAEQREFVTDARTLIRRHLETGYAEALYGIEAGGAPAGLLALLPPELGIDYPEARSDEAWLEGFRIDARFQGQGVAGKALTGIATLAARRYARLSLTVNLRNDKAEAAYRRFGFRDTGALYHGGPAGPQRILTLDLNEGGADGEGA
ncbi:GNAT family N-acetyltransferase [Arhodomonas sp. AD133]|uniref:GNAT family N-acetyltransferase n=1 Tax=Arhodomonas sp. AD133 TaxID=3415009 RepID=UPI003EBDD92B